MKADFGKFIARLQPTAAIIAVQAILCSLPLLAAEPATVFNLVPRPMKLSLLPGTFPLARETVIVADAAGEVTARYLAEAIRPLLGATLAVYGPDAVLPPRAIVLKIDPALKSLGPEGYALEITPDRVEMRATEAAGFFYACQTFRQLLLDSSARGALKPCVIPCVAIEDQPQFPWRGLMLDPARHFLGKDFVKRYIDLLASYKLNRLHLHLTDDDGWTLEIKRYPQLTDISQWPLKFTDRKRDYYRQKDIREIVAYAAARHVTVVPEIEMPGHNAVAGWLLRDSLLCPNNPYRAGGKPWDDKVSYQWTEPCVASPTARTVYQNIFAEVMELFPSSYIHLGGDEYFGLAWEQCPDCRRLLESKNLWAADSPEIKRIYAKCLGSKQKYLWYRWWMTKMCDYIRSRGRNPILWDDPAWRGRFPEGVTVLQWHSPGCWDGWLNSRTSENPAVEAAQAGRNVIVAPCDHLYLYFNDGEGVDSSPKAIYQLEVVPPILPLDTRSRILGPHGCVWAQRQEEIDKWLVPRLYSLAEIAWSPREPRDWEAFSRRLNRHQEKMTVFIPPSAPSTSGRLTK